MKREKGKIARTEWPAIFMRFDHGETFASIARSYGCTAPAIRYIVGRRADQPSPAERRDDPDMAGPEAQKEPSLSPLKGGTGERTGDARPGGHPPAPFERPPLINPALSERLNSDIATFIAALDTSATEDTAETRRALLDITDRLMRSAARLRIELELRSAQDRDAGPSRQTAFGAPGKGKRTAGSRFPDPDSR